ncbi:hypothetical protein ScPMuIL_013240 [Solemya velum]
MITSLITAHAETIHSVKCHPTNPEVFLSASQDGSIYMWDTRKSKPVTVIDSCNYVPTCLTWHPHFEHTFAFGTETGEIVVKDTRQDVNSAISFNPHSRSVYQLEFSKERSNFLASVSEDCSVVVTSVEKQAEQMYKNTEHKDFVHGLSWSGGDKFYTCGWDGLVKSHVLNNVKHEPKSLVESLNMEVNGDCGGQRNMDTSPNENTIPTESADTPSENTDTMLNENAIDVISDET